MNDDHLLNGLELRPEMKALDFGLGSGHISRELLQAGLHVTAVDIDPESGPRFEASLSESQKKQFRFHPLDANSAHWPFNDASFDLVVCREVLEHIEEYVHTVREFRRVLKAEGVLALSVPHARSERVFRWFDPDWFDKCEHVNVFPPDGLLDLLRNSGFDCFHCRGTGFRWAFMWSLLAPFRIDHRMGVFRPPGRLTTWAHTISGKVAATPVNRIGNRLFPKSTTVLARKRRWRLLVVCDYPDWILGTWAEQIRQLCEDQFDVDAVAAREIDAEFAASDRGTCDIVHTLLPHAFERGQMLRSRVHITTVHHWTQADQYADVLRRAEHIVTGASEWKHKMQQRGVPAERITVVHSGVSDAFLHDLPDRRHDDPLMRIGFFAKGNSNEDDRKGSDRLKQLARRIVQHGLADHYRLVLSGDGWEETAEEIRSFGLAVDDRGRVPREHVPALYDDVDAYLVLSRVEGGPATTAEAMARGCLVISTPVGLSADVVQHDVNGFLISQENAVADTLDLLESLRPDPERRARVSRTAAAFARDHLPYAVTFANLKRLYIDMVRRLADSLPSFSIEPSRNGDRSDDAVGV